MTRETIAKIVKARGVSTGELILIHFWGENADKTVADQFAAAVAALGASPVVLQQARSVNREIFAGAKESCFDDAVLWPVFEVRRGPGRIRLSADRARIRAGGCARWTCADTRCWTRKWRGHFILPSARIRCSAAKTGRRTMATSSAAEKWRCWHDRKENRRNGSLAQDPGAAGAAGPCVPTTARMRQHLKDPPTLTFPARSLRLPKSCWHETRRATGASNRNKNPSGALTGQGLVIAAGYPRPQTAGSKTLHTIPRHPAPVQSAGRSRHRGCPPARNRPRTRSARPHRR